MWQTSLQRLQFALRAPIASWLGLRWDRVSLPGGIALAMAFAAIWMLGRLYRGITHDATLYLAQGLRRLNPEVFARDVFFAHGSQDSYSLFTLLYSPLIDAIGPESAALAMTAFGQVTFILAAWMLAGAFAAGSLRWWSLASLAAISGYYGGLGVFRFAEPFATARSLAEPLVVLAMASVLANRPRIAMAALAGATLLHPLVAAPGIAAVILWHVMERKRLFSILAIAAASGTAIFLLSWPAALAPFDAAWREAVLERSPHLFLTEWEWADWARVLWGLAICAVAQTVLPSQPRRLVTAATGTCIAGLIASWIGVDLLDAPLIASLQLWRAHWPLHLLAILLVPVVISNLWRMDNASRVASACIAASCCFGRADMPAASILAAMAAAIVFSRDGRSEWMTDSRYRLSLLALGGAAATGLMFSIQANLPAQYGAMHANVWLDSIQIAGSMGFLIPAAAVLGTLCHSRFAESALALALASFIAAAIAWDARSGWSRAIEQAASEDHPFRIISPGAEVFWAASSTPAWLVLRTRSWFSGDQGAGIVFNRATALDYAARRIESQALRIAIDNCEFVQEPLCRLDTRRARALCELKNGPDYLVLNGQTGTAARAEWPIPYYAGFGPAKLYLYACGDLTWNAGGAWESPPP